MLPKLGSSDPATTASQMAGTTDACYHNWVFFKNMVNTYKFCTVDIVPWIGV